MNVITKYNPKGVPRCFRQKSCDKDDNSLAGGIDQMAVDQDSLPTPHLRPLLGKNPLLYSVNKYICRQATTHT